MKIEAFSVAAVRHRNLDPDWYYAGRDVPELPGLRVALRAGQNMGEGYAPFLPHLNSTPEELHDIGLGIASGLVGSQMDDLDKCIAELGPCSRMRNAARSAVEMALLDLAARARGVSVTAMMGGDQRPLEVLRIIPVKAAARMAELAGVYRDEGYRALKLKATGDLDEDEARIASVRNVVGPQVMIIVDANQAYDADGALKLEKRLRSLRVWSLEQPVSAADRVALSRVREEAEIFIEADEGLFSIADLEALVAARAADGISLKLARSGGVLPSRGMARYGAESGLHARLGTAFGGPLVTLATASLNTLVDAVGPAECAEFEHFNDDDHAFPQICDGKLLPPEGPGFGQERLKPWPAPWEA